ncbi:hypothetical protein PISMIDRAFT_688988 [Pisolithus microcarpus 441]|uniref:Uncharacterized protein n=1 Tax=Pisolithus microcarpus 441 TaxID=765257 RepID=A0A0C9YS17_9AGAM|nr:hypothetical protein PISMIDRAFT_688988 [Pisolithus microcarpus 441]
METIRELRPRVNARSEKKLRSSQYYNAYSPVGKVFCSKVSILADADTVSDTQKVTECQRVRL